MQNLYILTSEITNMEKCVLSPPTKLGGDIGMVSVRPFVRPSGVSDIISKRNHSIRFKLNVGIYWVSVQN